MNYTTLLFVILKITAVLAAAQVCLTTMRRATAAMRHIVCAASLAGCLLVPVLPYVPGVALASVAVPIPAMAQFSINVSASQSRVFPVAAPFVALWITGAVFLLARTWFGYRELHRKLRGAGSSGAAGRVPVLIADVGVPFVSGLRRPKIALPREWPQEFREAALRHELAHVDRLDLWTELLTRIVCAVYWFHPLVWMTSARLRVEREAACDDAVLNSGYYAPAYADALLAAARGVASMPMVGCSMLDSASLKARMARLLDTGLQRMSSRQAKLRAGIAMAIGLVAIGILIPARAQDAAQTTSPAADRQPESAPPDGIYTVGGEVSAPSVQSHVEPVYPDDAREEKISGTLQMELVVGADGIAREIVIVKGLTPSLNNSAINAVQQWRFNPGYFHGEPVAVKATVQVNFKLM